MDPVSIVGLVASCVTIAGRLGALIEATPGLVTSYRETGQSIRRLGNQLRLFQGTVEELQKWLRRSPQVSARVRTNLNASLESCQDIITDIERHVDRVVPAGGDVSNIGAAARVRHVWDEASVDQREQRILTQMQMIDIYIRALHLNDPGDQESILDTASTVALIERSNDDARTIRSEWCDESASTIVPESSVRQHQTPAVQASRRSSMLKKFKALTLSQRAREKLADELLRACENRNMTLVHHLVEKGASPNETTSDGRIPFIATIQRGQFTIVKALLDHGARPDLRWRHTESSTAIISTPLTVAIEAKSASIVRLLIKHGAPVTTKDRNDDSLLFAAIKSGEPEILTALLEAGADCEVNTPNSSYSMSPLEAAIDQRKIALARALLEYGADIEPRGQQPLICRAILRSNNVTDLVQELIDRGADVNGRCGRIKLKDIRHYGAPPSFQEEYVKNVSAVMLLARQAGDHAALRVLLQNGADANAKMLYEDLHDWEVGSPLHEAADDVVVELLIKHGARVNDLAAFEETPLERALLRRRHRTAVSLLKAGAEVNLHGMVKRTELDYFAESLPSSKTTAEDASHFSDEKECYTMRKSAQESFLKVLAYLLAAGADPRQREGPPEEFKNEINLPLYTRDGIWRAPGSVKTLTFVEKCNKLMEEAARRSPASRRTDFLSGKNVLGVNRHSPIGADLEELCYERVEKIKT